MQRHAVWPGLTGCDCSLGRLIGNDDISQCAKKKHQDDRDVDFRLERRAALRPIYSVEPDLLQMPHRCRVSGADLRLRFPAQPSPHHFVDRPSRPSRILAGRKTPHETRCPPRAWKWREWPWPWRRAWAWLATSHASPPPCDSGAVVRRRTISGQRRGLIPSSCYWLL